MRLVEVAKDVHETAVLHGWYECDCNVGEVIALMHSELSEALEEWRDGHPLTEIRYEDGKPEGFPIEMADAMIRILDTCHHLGIDIEEAIAIKAMYNKSRPYRHGKKLA